MTAVIHFMIGSVTTMKMHKTLLATVFSAGLLATAGAQAAGWCESGNR